MKKIILFLCLGCLCCCSCSGRQKKSNLKVNVVVLGKLSKDDFRGENGDFYSVRIDLVNNTDSIFDFWIMSCSWDVNFISDRKTLFGLYNRGCDKNELKLKQIKSGETLSYYGVIQILESSIIEKKEKVKLGFIVIREYEISSRSSFRILLSKKRLKECDIVWSNLFSFPQSHRI